LGCELALSYTRDRPGRVLGLLSQRKGQDLLSLSMRWRESYEEVRGFPEGLSAVVGRVDGAL